MSLNADLIAIGFRLATIEKVGRASTDLDLERTLVNCAIEIVEQNDARLFAVALSWLNVHARYVHLDKFLKYIQSLPLDNSSKFVLKAFVVYGAELNLPNWKKAISKLRCDGHFAFRGRRAEDFDTSKFNESYESFREVGFFINKNSVRIRPSDCLPPSLLAKKNKQYKNRVLFGANWRADLFTLYDSGVPTAYAAAKILGCSKETARKIFNDWDTYRQAFGYRIPV